MMLPHNDHCFLIYRCCMRPQICALQNTRQALFKRLRSRVGQILLPVQPPFRASLQQVRGHVQAIGHAAVFSLGPPEGGGAWELDPFMQLQGSLRDAELQRELDGIAASIQEVSLQGLVDITSVCWCWLESSSSEICTFLIIGELGVGCTWESWSGFT